MSDLIKYQPFALRGDLSLVFAKISTTNELLRFINNYGPLNDYYTRAPVWEYGEKNSQPGNPKLVSYMTSTGIDSYWRCEDGRELPADFIPGDPVPDGLRAAAAFRELLKLKQTGSRKQLASLFHDSFFNTSIGVFHAGHHASLIDFIPDPKIGIRLRLRPPTMLGALWYQLGIKLSGNAIVKVCRQCNEFFEAGRGTRLRSDAQFCCNEHKVEYFNRKRITKQKRNTRKKRKARN